MNDSQVRDSDFNDENEPFEQADIEVTLVSPEPSSDAKPNDKKQMFTLVRRRVEERLELKRIFDDDNYFSVDREY